MSESEKASVRLQAGDNRSVELPLLSGSLGPDVIDIR